MTTKTCASCGVAVAPDAPSICERCTTELGPALSKALVNESAYAMRLRDGTVLRFTGVDRHGEWLHVKCVTPVEISAASSSVLSEMRSIQVRIADVAWAADAPVV